MSALQTVHVGLDELEAMRLCDLEGYDQQEAGARMGVSRGTVQRMLSRARKKLVDAVVSGNALAVDAHAASALDSCLDEEDGHHVNANHTDSRREYI
jgi:predicted DNA-binding protein (UPF0251 family)